MDILAYFDIAVTFDALVAVGTGPTGFFIHCNHVSTGDSCSAITMQIATSYRPYPVALIVAVDLEICERSGAINVPMASEIHTASHTKFPMIGLIQSVADGT
jgi:hypothetical protein